MTKREQQRVDEAVADREQGTLLHRVELRRDAEDGPLLTMDDVMDHLKKWGYYEEGEAED